MTGSHILSHLLTLPSSQISSVSTISRRAPIAKSERLTAHVDSDTSKWASLISPPPQILFSALATTRGAAGGFENQYTLEHDLNITLAKAARDHATPTNTYVLISSANANADSLFGYVKMKGEIERDILALDFAHTVILRPGLIGGRREESRPSEAVIRWIADGLGSVSGGALKDFWAQDADVIARAAVRAGLKAANGGYPAKCTILGGKEIMALGRDPLTDAEKA